MADTEEARRRFGQEMISSLDGYWWLQELGLQTLLLLVPTWVK